MLPIERTAFHGFSGDGRAGPVSAFARFVMRTSASLRTGRRFAVLFALLPAALSNAQAPRPAPFALRAALQQAIGLAACAPSGEGRDYEVGDGPGQLASLDRVPWEKLSAGDTVRIHYRAKPYAGKFIVAAKGTRKAPVRICGMPGPNGERPEVTGRDALTRRNLGYGHPLHESRSVIVVKPFANQPWEAFPAHIQVDGLKITGAHPDHGFVDTHGKRQAYDRFGACIWLERGHDITIADNEIAGCSQAIFSKSTDDGEFARTTRIRVAGNDMHDNGIAGYDRTHTTYMQSVGIVYEFNRYGPLLAGARGNSLKDRSAGTVVRYNRIEDGARALDLVEAEDFPEAAKADPAYRSTFVYGNQIVKDGRKGSTIHYGGDHNGSSPGESWGEPNNRKGTLHFFHNTVRITGNGYAAMFQLSTTEERADVRNNIFIFDASTRNPSMRATTEVGDAWTPGGIVVLGRNWITRGWRDKTEAAVGGELQGRGNLIEGTAPPVELPGFRPKPGSAVIDAAGPLAAAAAKHPVLYQLDAGGVPRQRKLVGVAPDIGAVERD